MEREKEPSVKDYKTSLTLIESMDRLATQISKLITLFEQANKEMHAEYQQGFHQDAQKLDQLIHQNERIAKGILALADNHLSTNPSYPLKSSEESTPPWKREEEVPATRKSIMREFQ
ncbi:MAG: hypothetical protein ACMXYD_00570 [Candidatus Woesearchaeota archaeon]